MTASESGSSGEAPPNTLLTVDDLKAIIEQAQAASVEPVSLGIQIFNALGDNLTVSGDILRQALAESKIVLEGPLGILIDSVQLVTKNADNVTLTNRQELQTTINGVPIKLKPVVTLSAGTEGGCPTIGSIKGVAVHKLFWFDIQEIQVRENQGQRILHVVTSGGTREFPLA
jgi:hypothetical protein